MREKFRDSDVELRNSASAKEGENNESSKQLIGSSSKKLKGLLIGGIVFSTAILIAIIITYFAVYKNVDDQVNSISEVYFIIVYLSFIVIIITSLIFLFTNLLTY